MNALAEVKANMVITTKQRQKQGLEQMLEVLQQLREAAHLHDALRCNIFWHACSLACRLSSFGGFTKSALVVRGPMRIVSIH